jgi:hypothetical protein
VDDALGAGGGDIARLWGAWDPDGGLDDDGGALLWWWENWALTLLWAVGDETRVGWNVWRAETLEVLAGLVNFRLGATVSLDTLEDVLGEVWLRAEAGDVRVGLALLWEPGVQAGWDELWAWNFRDRGWLWSTVAWLIWVARGDGLGHGVGDGGHGHAGGGDAIAGGGEWAGGDGLLDTVENISLRFIID